MKTAGARFARESIRGRRCRAAAIVVILAALAPFAFADDPVPSYDRINLGYSASDEVANDILVAVMFYQRDGENAAQLADDVNRTLRWAVEIAVKSPGVKVQTLQYHSTPVYRNQILQGWRVRQALRLESV